MFFFLWLLSQDSEVSRLKKRIKKLERREEIKKKVPSRSLSREEENAVIGTIYAWIALPAILLFLAITGN